MKKIIVGSLLMVLLISSCEKDKGLWYSKNWEKEHPNGQGTSAPGCDTAGVISYSVSVLPVIQNLCSTAGCHVSGGSAANYTNFNILKMDAQNGQLMFRMDLPTSNFSHMPQGGGFVPACDTLKIKKWILSGCPQN